MLTHTNGVVQEQAQYLHEEVGDPHGVEEVPRALQLVAVVLLEVEEGHHVGVPRLQVHGDGALALAAALPQREREMQEEDKANNTEEDIVSKETGGKVRAGASFRHEAQLDLARG